MKYISRLIPIIIVFLAACQEDPAPTGVTLLPPGDLIDVVKFSSSDSLVNVETATYFRANSGSTSTRLWLGEVGGYTSQVVLQWFNFTEPIGDEGTILEATMTLRTRSAAFGGEPGIIAFDVMEISDSINTSTLTSENISTVPVFPEPRGSYSGTDSVITVALDTAMVREWMRRFTRNVGTQVSEHGPEPYGILLKPAGMNYIQAFNAIDNLSEFPGLTLIVQREDGLDTLEGLALRDTYIAQGPDYSAQPLSVHGGLSYRGRIKFDLSGIPQGSIINFVRLTLTRDPASEVRNSAGIDSLLVYEALSDDEDVTSVSSTLVQPVDENKIVFTAEGTVTTATMILAVQRWVNNPASNHGLIIAKLAEISDLHELNFFGGTADPDKRPRLEVFYTTKP